MLLIVTYIQDDFVGFLDFSQRIRAAAALGPLTVIGRNSIKGHKDFAPEFDGIAFDEIVVPAASNLPGLLKYLIACRRTIARLRPRAVVYLGTQLAPLAWLSRTAPGLLYWNEHPLHIYGEARSRIKKAFKTIMMWATFQGARASRVVMPIGEALEADLLSRGVRRERCRLQYMGVGPTFAELAHVEAPQQQPLRLLYAGSVEKLRGRDEMLEAMSLLKARGVPATLTIIGASDEQRDYCRAFARNNDLEDRIVVHGRLPRTRVPEFFSQADLGLCIWANTAYWQFNPPTKLFEYLSAGIPVLASRIRTHSDYIRDWDNGLLFDYSSEGLSRAVETVWQCRDTLPDMRKNAHAQGANYAWSTIEPQFQSLVREAAGLAH